MNLLNILFQFNREHKELLSKMICKDVNWIFISFVILNVIADQIIESEDFDSPSSTNQALADERKALMRFYDSTSIPDDSSTISPLLVTGDPFTDPIPQKIWRNDESWGSKKSVDKWFGVTTDEVSGRVTKLMLQGNNLQGSLSDLSALSYLTELDLRANKINGPIPSSIGLLTS